MSWTEIAGFATGAACVWLIVKQNAWNFPVGIANNTDVLATSVWHERYVGERSPSVEEMTKSHVPDLYLLTDCDIPFVQDGLRDGEHVRESMTARFREVLNTQAAPWVEISGSRKIGLGLALAAVDQVVERGWHLASPLGSQTLTCDVVSASQYGA